MRIETHAGISVPTGMRARSTRTVNRRGRLTSPVMWRRNSTRAARKRATPPKRSIETSVDNDAVGWAIAVLIATAAITSPSDHREVQRRVADAGHRVLLPAGRGAHQAVLSDQGDAVEVRRPHARHDHEAEQRDGDSGRVDSVELGARTDRQNRLAEGHDDDQTHGAPRSAPAPASSPPAGRRGGGRTRPPRRATQQAYTAGPWRNDAATSSATAIAPPTEFHLTVRRNSVSPSLARCPRATWVIRTTP